MRFTKKQRELKCYYNVSKSRINVNLNVLKTVWDVADLQYPKQTAAGGGSRGLSSRLPILFARPTVTFPASEHHRHWL